MSATLRRTYVQGMQALRRGLEPTGLLDRLDRGGRRARWLRSLFAIYDLDDLVRLDLPWWTFDAIDAVAQHLAARPGARVFEWGSGASTVWLSRRGARVVSVEHDARWAAEVRRKIDTETDTDSVDLRCVPPTTEGRIASQKAGFEGQFFDAYVAAIHAVPGVFDLIVIDGRARAACLAEATQRLAPGGIVLIDDFKRRRYRIAAEASGLTARRLDGLAVCLPLPDSTALLSRAA